MGEDLEIIDVDVRQRKSGKNKNPNDDIVSSGGGGGDGHGSSKRRRRGRGGDRSEGIKVIPEEEVPSEPKEKKGKVIINKKPESDDEVEDDDAYDSSLEDEESSGSWLFKLIIIAIVVSLGFSLIWLNDGSSSTELDGVDTDVETLNDISDSYNPEKVDSEEEIVGRADIEPDIESANYQVYQEGQEYNQQWSQEYGDSSSSNPEIIAEVSETIGEQSSDETEYQESRDQGYYETTVSDHQESVETGTWVNELDAQPEHRVEEQFTPSQEPEPVNSNQQTDHNYDQQSWQYQEQQQDLHQEPAQPYEAYQHHSEPEQLAQSPIEINPEIPETNEFEPVIEERYYECPEGSYWDGLSCVNPETFVQMDDFNNAYEKQPENNGENILP